MITRTPEDTIVGIATAMGEGGISIVRISGAGTLAISDKIFRCCGALPSQRDGGTFIHGYVSEDPSPGQDSGSIIDEAVLLIFRAPHSYTREDVVEIQGHGGVVSAQRILRRALAAGCRLAEPGEFTKRAFLNGRLDLAQAEAVLDLIRASSDRAAAAAVEQLCGSLSRCITSSYDRILSLVTDLESGLDFPDDEMPSLLLQESQRAAGLISKDLSTMLATWDEGHVLRDGVLTVISGKPNVGKSTLFNALLGADRAIVADHPGTTRDTLEENFIIDGILLRLVDTAGLRETHCDIEHQGVLRARFQMQKADLHIHVLDASLSLDDADMADIKALPADRTIVVLNKVDLGGATRPSDIAKHTVLSVCLLAPGGVHNLKTTLAGKLAKYSQSPVRTVISERHRQAISAAAEHVREATDLLAGGREEVLVAAASLLRSAAEELATVTGRVYYDDLLERVFSRFCIGK